MVTYNRFSGIARDRRGSIAVIFGVAAIPLMACVGLAIDYGNASRMHQRLKTSLDAAVLAGIVEQANGNDATATVTAFLQAKFQGTGITPAVTVTSGSSDGTLTATARFDLPTSFMRMIGHSTVDIRARTKAAVGAGAGGPIEVAIAFDTTASMTGTKLASAQTAANQLIDQMFTIPGTSTRNPNVKAGLVPFASYVNVGMTYRNAAWLTNSNDRSSTTNSCWMTYPNAVYSNPIPRSGTCTNDGVPYTCTWTDYTVDYGTGVQVCGNVTTTQTWYGCVGSQDASHDARDEAQNSHKVPAMLDTYCPAPLIRLTNDPAPLKAAVDGLTASGETYIAPGLLWGWRLLTPNDKAPFSDGAPYGQAKKILILLTDGANTHSAQYASGGNHEGGDASAANAKVLETCANIKSTGIHVYSIAFDVSDTTIQSVLSQCSSGPPYYYNAQTVGDLQGAFQSIGSQLVMARLVE